MYVCMYACELLHYHMYMYLNTVGVIQKQIIWFNVSVNHMLRVHCIYNGGKRNIYTHVKNRIPPPPQVLSGSNAYSIQGQG